MWKVVYATDFSDQSNKVLSVIMKYRELIGEVVIVRVINIHRISFPFVNAKEIIEKETAYAKEKIAELRDFLNNYGIKCEKHHIPVGDPAEEIARVAEEENADVIFMGSRGKSLRKILLGSVAEGIVKISKVPVLTVKNGINVFDRVLYVHYPLDSKVPDILYDLGKVAEKIYVTHVVEPMLPPESTKHVFDEKLKKAESVIESIKNDLTSRGIDAEGFVGIGCPPVEILRIAEDECNATCIVLKPPKRRVTRVTDCVLRHSEQSVMVIKEREDS